MIRSPDRGAGGHRVGWADPDAGEWRRAGPPPPRAARVTPVLVVASTVVAALVVVAGVASTLARRRIGLVHLALTAVLEVLLVVQTAVALAAIDGDTPDDLPTFLSYLFGTVLVPIAGVLWARTEVTRWAGTVLAVAGAAVGVMVWRLLDLWEFSGV